jgi:hypothetical protein
LPIRLIRDSIRFASPGLEGNMPDVRWTAVLEGDGMVPIRVRPEPVAAEGLERVVVQLSPGEGERDVQLAPSASALKLLLVELSRYDSGVTYKVNGAGDAVALTGPQLFAGGATALLGDVDSLAFSEPGEPTEVRILCARDATPA